MSFSNMMNFFLCATLLGASLFTREGTSTSIAPVPQPKVLTQRAEALPTITAGPAANYKRSVVCDYIFFPDFADEERKMHPHQLVKKS